MGTSRGSLRSYERVYKVKTLFAIPGRYLPFHSRSLVSIQRTFPEAP